MEISSTVSEKLQRLSHFGWESKVLWTDKINFATYGPEKNKIHDAERRPQIPQQ